MITITCLYCNTPAPPGEHRDEAVEAALADGFVEFRDNYLCDSCARWQNYFMPTHTQEKEPTMTTDYSFTQEAAEILLPAILPDNKYSQKTLFQMMPERERPARRIAELGVQALSDTELIAAVIGGVNQIEIAQNLVAKYGDLRKIYSLHAQLLTETVKGLTEASALRLKAAIALGFRAGTQSEYERPSIQSPADSAALVQYEMSALDHEQLWVMVLDRRNRVMELAHVYKGSVSSSQVRIAEVLEPAIKIRGSAIIVFHNHRAQRSAIL